MNILIIEDEAFSAMVTIAFFKDDGHTVVHATNADEALTSLGSAIPDVVICDWNIGGTVSAAEIIKAVREINPTVKIAFVTGHSRDTLGDKLTSLEPFSFYTKPVNFEVLVKELTTVQA